MPRLYVALVYVALAILTAATHSFGSLFAAAAAVATYTYLNYDCLDEVALACAIMAAILLVIFGFIFTPTHWLLAPLNSILGVALGGSFFSWWVNLTDEEFMPDNLGQAYLVYVCLTAGPVLLVGGFASQLVEHWLHVGLGLGFWVYAMLIVELCASTHTMSLRFIKAVKEGCSFP